jgi:hypothetical protein
MIDANGMIGCGSNRGRLVWCRGLGHPTRLDHTTKHEERGLVLGLEVCTSVPYQFQWASVSTQTPDSCRSRRSADVPILEEDGTAWFELDNKLKLKQDRAARELHHTQQISHRLLWYRHLMQGPDRVNVSSIPSIRHSSH